MPADGFDAAAKKNRDLGTSRWQLPKAMGGTYISGKNIGRGVAVTVSAAIRG